MNNTTRLPEPTLVYIAGPYTADNWVAKAANVARAQAVAREVAARGYFPVVPHLMSAGIEHSLDESQWLAGTMEVMRKCRAVVLVPNWHASRGTQAEVAEAGALGIPVYESAGGLPDLAGPGLALVTDGGAA